MVRQVIHVILTSDTVWDVNLYVFPVRGIWWATRSSILS